MGGVVTDGTEVAGCSFGADISAGFGGGFSFFLLAGVRAIHSNFLGREEVQFTCGLPCLGFMEGEK